jgi:hypothetical protein
MGMRINLSREQKAEIENLYQSRPDLTVAAIGAMFGVGPTRVTRVINSAGIKQRVPRKTGQKKKNMIKCLKCDKFFRSKSRFNRLCRCCREVNAASYDGMITHHDTRNDALRIKGNRKKGGQP